MTTVQLRDSDAARRYLTQGLWLQRLSPTNPDTIRAPLNCALCLAATDHSVPPTGFIADVIRLVMNERSAPGTRTPVVNDLSPEKVRAYEDYVLGKLYADATFERASVAASRYPADDRIKAIAWMIARICERTGFSGVLLSPAVARNLQGLSPEELVTQGAQSLQAQGLMPLLNDGYEELISRVRSTGQVLSAEDLFELEKGTALIEFGQRLALRQVLRIAETIEASLPLRVPRASSRARNVPTHIMEEDMYPVGGFTSISTRGSIESLLHSQLAFMEKEESRRPDLFEIKFLRSELLYYSRDENQFLRRRRVIQMVLFPDLTECRIKDDAHACQRLIMLLGLQIALTRKLIAWLSNDALIIEYLFVKDGAKSPLEQEKELLTLILEEQIQNGTVIVTEATQSQIPALAEEHARRSTTHSLMFAWKPPEPIHFQQAMPVRISLRHALPAMTFHGETTSLACTSFEDLAQHLAAELV